jgi:hypothetical protein
MEGGAGQWEFNELGGERRKEQRNLVRKSLKWLDVGQVFLKLYLYLGS